MFIESVITKWKLGPFDRHDSSLVVAKIPVHFSVATWWSPGRHPAPVGKYLVSMNKLSKAGT
jgi:hypothetical protein